MKLKEQKKLGMLYFVLGAVLTIAGYFIKSSWLASFFICIYAQLLAVLAAILFFHQPLIGKVLCVLTCIQSLIYTGCYWYYNRKY